MQKKENITLDPATSKWLSLRTPLLFNIKKSKPIRLLSIDPGAIHLGIAFFEGNNLLDYAVRVIQPRNSIRERLMELEIIITRYIKEKKPDLIALEKSNFSQQTNNGLMTLAYYKIKAAAKRSRVPVEEYAPATIRKTVCGHGHARKYDLKRAVLARYPVLRALATSNRRWKEVYYGHLFDAVAVGLTYLKLHGKNGGEKRT